MGQNLKASRTCRGNAPLQIQAQVFGEARLIMETTNHSPPLPCLSSVPPSDRETAALYCTPLDWLNFFLADVRGGLVPYVGIFLLTEQHWNQASIGIVATVSGIIGLALQTPIGAFIDATQWKRGVVVAGVGVLTVSALTIAVAPSFPPVLAAQTMMGIAGDVFGPAVAAITLGVLGSRGLAYRMGRNAAFDHAGNISIAVIAGAVGWWFSQSAVFYLVPIVSLLAASAVLSIPARAIDHARARGLDRNQSEAGEQPSGWSVLIACKPLLVFAHVRRAVPLWPTPRCFPRRTEAGAGTQGGEYGPHVGLHRRRTARHAADGAARRRQGGRLGAQADLPRGVRHPADPRRALHDSRTIAFGWSPCSFSRASALASSER